MVKTCVQAYKDIDNEHEGQKDVDYVHGVWVSVVKTNEVGYSQSLVDDHQ